MFVKEDGSFLSVTKALCEDYAGLVDRDEVVLTGIGQTLTLRFEVNSPTVFDPYYSRLSAQCSSIAQWPGYTAKDYQVGSSVQHPARRLTSKILASCCRLVCTSQQAPMVKTCHRGCQVRQEVHRGMAGYLTGSIPS